jgi:hypothetical protein
MYRYKFTLPQTQHIRRLHCIRRARVDANENFVSTGHFSHHSLVFALARTSSDHMQAPVCDIWICVCAKTFGATLILDTPDSRHILFIATHNSTPVQPLNSSHICAVFTPRQYLNHVKSQYIDIEEVDQAASKVSFLHVRELCTDSSPAAKA